MTYNHPVGDDHPFSKTHELAQRQGFEKLEIVNLEKGALIRLFVCAPDLVFRLDGDPGSALDRQSFDYSTHIVLAPASPQNLLETIMNYATGDVGSESTP